MISKKFKQEIINDYFCLASANNFCLFCFASKKLDTGEKNKLDLLLHKSDELLQIYKKIMFKLNLIDLSLAILDKEILFSNKQNKEEPLEDKNCLALHIEKTSENVKKINENLLLKTKKMKLNEFELNYLKIDIASKY